MLLCFHRTRLQLLPTITIDCLQVTFGMSQILVKSPAENIYKNPAELFVYLVLFFYSILVENLNFRMAVYETDERAAQGSFVTFPNQQIITSLQNENPEVWK